MTSPNWLWPQILTASAVAVGGLMFGDLGSPVRPVVALWFLVFCPGMAVVRLLQLRDAWAEVALATAVSLSLDVGVATALVYAGYWSSKLALAILIAITLIGVILQLRIMAGEPADVSIPASDEVER